MIFGGYISKALQICADPVVRRPIAFQSVGDSTQVGAFSFANEEFAGTDIVRIL